MTADEYVRFGIYIQAKASQRLSSFLHNGRLPGVLQKTDHSWEQKLEYGMEG
jgi:hypothetical protein